MKGMRRCLLAVVLVGVAMSPLQADAAEAAPSGERSATYAARVLRVHDLTARLTVEPEDRPDMALVVRGPAKAVDAVRAEVKGDTLELTGGADPDGSVSVIQMNNVTTVVTGGGSASVTIGGRDATVHVPARPPLLVTVRVPRHTAVTVERVADVCTIGDIEAPLRLTVASASVSVGRVGSTDLTIDGTGDVRIRGVRGDLAVAVRGSGEVTVDSAEIGDLAVAISGSGDVVVEGRARTASLAISGSGDVRVKEVTARPRVSVTGAGNVAVGNW